MHTQMKKIGMLTAMLTLAALLFGDMQIAVAQTSRAITTEHKAETKEVQPYAQAKQLLQSKPVGSITALSGTLKMVVIQATSLEDNISKTFQSQPSRKVFLLESSMGEYIVSVRKDSKSNQNYSETSAEQKLQRLANKEVLLTGFFIDNSGFMVEEKSVDEAIANLPTVEVNHFAENFINLPTDLTHGTKKVLVIRANFLNDTSQPLSDSQVREQVFTGTNSTKNFFQEASFSRFRISSHFDSVAGDVTPYVTINYDNSNCEGLMFTSWTQNARSRAQEFGYFQSFYKHIIVVFNTIPSCTLEPAGQAGTLGDMGNVSYSYLQANQLNAYNATYVLGRNLGALEAEGWKLYDGPRGERSDRGDFMGSAYVYPSNWQRLRFGWLVGNYYAITQSTWYRLVSPSIPIRGSKTAALVYIPLRNQQGQLTGECMWLESRKNQGFDNFLPLRMSYVNGVAVRYAPCDLNNNFLSSKILDMVPGTQTYDDAPLMNGVYTDVVNDVSISTYQINNTVQGPVVNIQLGPRY